LRVSERFKARGHRLVAATHVTTLMLTKDDYLTERGDCIVAIGSEKGAADLSPEFREAARNPSAVVTVTISCNGVSDVVRGRGSERLTVQHPSDLVLRKSSFVCSRTVATRIDKPAAALNRQLIAEIRKGLEVEICMGVSSGVTSLTQRLHPPPRGGQFADPGAG